MISQGKLLTLRQARPEDAAAIAQAKDAIWPEEATSADYLAQALQQPDRHTLLALDGEQIVGFVDGFLTLDEVGQRRWEVDLLAVLPSQRRRGLGAELVRASTRIGWQMGAQVARGLVATANVGSQRAFAKGGYGLVERPLNLWVWANNSLQARPNANRQAPPDSYLLPVITLNYQGLWLEGAPSAAGLQAAQAVCAHMGWQIAGTLIAVEQDALNETAKSLGYAFISQYQWCSLHSPLLPTES